jgi:hypothetical protein
MPCDYLFAILDDTRPDDQFVQIAPPTQALRRLRAEEVGQREEKIP